MGAADIDNDESVETIHSVLLGNSSSSPWVMAVNSIDRSGDVTFKGSTEVDYQRSDIEIKIGDVNNDGFVDLLVFRTTSGDCDRVLL